MSPPQRDPVELAARALRTKARALEAQAIMMDSDKQEVAAAALREASAILADAAERISLPQVVG